MTASKGAGSAKAVSASEQSRPDRQRRECACGAVLAATNRSGLCITCSTSKACPDCGTRISIKAARCRRHANAVHNADPAKRERKSATMRHKFADPVYRAQHAEKSRAATALLLAQPGELEKRREIGRKYGAANIEATRSPEVRARAGRAISATKLAHIPSEYRSYYRELKFAGYTAAEREAMVRELQEQDRANAATVIANNLERQRIKQRREQRDAY